MKKAPHERGFGVGVGLHAVRIYYTVATTDPHYRANVDAHGVAFRCASDLIVRDNDPPTTSWIWTHAVWVNYATGYFI